MAIFYRSFFLLIFVFLFLSCDRGNQYYGSLIYSDSELKLDEYAMFEKVRNVENKSISKNVKNSFSDFNKVSDMIFLPDEPAAIEESKLISINVTDEVPIIDLIMEIARLTEADVQIDPNIEGGIILNVKNKSLRYVYNRICGMSNVRYHEKNGIIIFEKDIPYTKTYNVNYLDLNRSSSASASISTSVISADGGSSSASVSGSTSDNFWKNLEDNVRQIIKITEETFTYYSDSAKKAQVKQKNGENSTSSSSDKSDSIIGGDMIIDQKSGILSVVASEKAHRRIKEYLETLEKKAKSQVLIEMKFLEISLSKQYEAGVNWSQALSNFTIQTAATFTSGIANPALYMKGAFGGMEAALAFFETFGSTRVLSSPRIMAVNNQVALMTVAVNEVYFDTESELIPSSSVGGTVTSTYRNIKSTANVVPLGVIMSVLASIDLDKREIMLNIKPTVSKSDKSVSDPSVELLGKDSTSTATPSTSTVSSQIPVISTRELDTLMKVADGQLSVIGGFTERKKKVTEDGVPILRHIPIIGNLFKYKKETYDTIETIILIKATIQDNALDMNSYEKDIYQTFSDDPNDIE